MMFVLLNYVMKPSEDKRAAAGSRLICRSRLFRVVHNYVVVVCLLCQPSRHIAR